MGASLSRDSATGHAPYMAPLPKWVRAKKYAEMSGITERAITHKRTEGVWPEGVIWKKAPDGNIMINWQEADAWVETGPSSPSMH